MREYYLDKEIEVIDYLINNYNYRIISNKLIMRFMNAVALEVDTDGSKTFRIVTERNDSEPDDERKFKKGERDIIDLIILLNGLEKDNLIKVVDSGLPHIYQLYDSEEYGYNKGEGINSNNDAQRAEGFRFKGWYYRTTKEGEKINHTYFYAPPSQGKAYLYDDIMNIINKIIIPTPALKDYKEKDYKTPTQRRFKKQSRFAITAIVVAVATSITSVILGLRDVKIDNNQMQDLKRSIEKVAPLKQAEDSVTNTTHKAIEILTP